MIYLWLVFFLLVLFMALNVEKAFLLYALNKKFAIFLLHAVFLLAFVLMIVHMFKRVITILDLRFKGLTGIEGPGG